jgi:ATP-dependent helicase HrpB
LQAALCGLDGPRFDEATWLTPPPAFAVDKARRRLQKMGAVDADGRVTDKGQRMAALPVGGDEARMLIDPPAPLAGAVADLVALMQLGRDLLLKPNHVKGNFEAVREARTELLAGLDNEVYVQLRCLRSGRPGRHGLHRSALREVRRIAASLRKKLGVQPADPTDDQTDLPRRDELAAFLLERIPESAFVVRKRALKRRNAGKARRGRSEPWGNGEIELDIWPFEPPVSERVERPDSHPVAGLVLDHFWLGNRGVGVRGTGRMVLPCGYDDLLRAGIGDEQISQVRAGSRRGKPYVRAQVETSHAGVVLDQGERPLEGRPLCEAAADAILDGHILRPAGARVLDDLHVWDVMARWPEHDRTWTKDEPPPEPANYLADRLFELGLRREDDLMLIEAADLRPALADELGALQYDIDAMRDDFPRVWEHQKRRYECTVHPASKKVILAPADKKTARSDDPNARLLPRFRSFRVIYKNDSRTVPIR